MSTRSSLTASTRSSNCVSRSESALSPSCSIRSRLRFQTSTSHRKVNCSSPAVSGSIAANRSRCSPSVAMLSSSRSRQARAARWRRCRLKHRSGVRMNRHTVRYRRDAIGMYGLDAIIIVLRELRSRLNKLTRKKCDPEAPWHGPWIAPSFDEKIDAYTEEVAGEFNIN